MYKRIIVSVILSSLIIIVSLGIASYLTVNDTISRSLDQRGRLAKMIAVNTDSIIENNLNRLFDISLSGGIDLRDNNWAPEKKALETAFQYSIFADGISLIDRNGTVVISHPPKIENYSTVLSLPSISKVMQDGRPQISDVYSVEPSKRKVIFALVPLKDKRGAIVGVAVGEMNPTTHMFNQIIKAAPDEPNTYIEVVDSHGVVLASNTPHRVFTGSDHNNFLASLIEKKQSTVRRCHRCHQQEGRDSGEMLSIDVLAFAPLEVAPWGVSILQPEADVFAPARKLIHIFFFFSVGSLGVALLMAIGMSRSIVKPVHELIDATHKIAAGDMSKSFGFGGVDEIGQLSSSFEIMRIKLADSLETLHTYNIQLEERVRERTEEIRESQRKVETLLNRMISVQEEERKRIARGLHDETMQALSALLMKLDMVTMYNELPPAERIQDMKDIVLDIHRGIHKIIQNLRPSILDDLGLEAAIRWLLDKHLWENGIAYFFNIIGTPGRRFDSQTEISLFRILQEIIVNIARHAQADNVLVIMKMEGPNLTVDIEDDGTGFDVASALKRTEDGRGLGLLGMKERASLLNGRLQICSGPGRGTRISLYIPIKPGGENYG